MPAPASWPPSPGYGDFGLLGKGLFPEPPPSGGLLDWVGFANFLARDRGGQEPRPAREAPRPMWQNSAGGLLGLFDGGQDRADSARSNKAIEAPIPIATAARGRGGRMGRAAYPPAPTTFDVGPPTSETVDFEAMMKTLHFDPNGPGEFAAAIAQMLRDPIHVSRGEVDLKVSRARDLSTDARDATREQFPTLRTARNNEADAFRHALWSFRMTRELGAEVAKRFGDAHEISYAGPAGELLMDIYNNNVGRRLALDPRNRERPPEDVIREALRDGHLQTRPINTSQGKQVDERPRGTSLGNGPGAAYVADTPGRYVRRYGGASVKGRRDAMRR